MCRAGGSVGAVTLSLWGPLHPQGREQQAGQHLCHGVISSATLGICLASLDGKTERGSVEF